MAFVYEIVVMVDNFLIFCCFSNVTRRVYHAISVILCSLSVSLFLWLSVSLSHIFLYQSVKSKNLSGKYQLRSELSMLYGGHEPGHARLDPLWPWLSFFTVPSLCPGSCAQVTSTKAAA